MFTYNLTILSIMRDSLGYFDRYLAQVNDAFSHFERCHLILCEGDSVDGTKARLAQIADAADTTVNGDVTVTTLDQGNPLMGHADHPRRWFALENAWNENLKHLEPTQYAVCVESDLIWAWPVLDKMIKRLDAGDGDVLCPLLMRDTPASGLYFFDTNAFRLHGQNFANYPPYHAELVADRLLTLDTGGGMLVTRGETLAKATWKDKCVLHWPDGARVVCDTAERIYHP